MAKDTPDVDERKKAESWAKAMRRSFKGVFTRREREHYLIEAKKRLEK